MIFINQVEGYKMMKGYFIIIFGLIFLLLGLLGLLSLNNSFNPTDLMLCFLGLFLIEMGVFNVKGYKNKTYYLTSFILIALYGLISVYSLLFIPLDKSYDYYNIGLSILLLILIIRAYQLRHESENPRNPWKGLPFKDEW